MTGKADEPDGIGGFCDHRLDRHFGDIGPGYSVLTNAADVKAQGAADRMWKKVEEDLDQIERAGNEEAEDG